MNDARTVHEIYHTKIRTQFRIIDEKNFTYRTVLSIINNYLKSKNRILDIGSGVGTIDFYLASKGYSVLGVDISENAIKASRKTAQNLNIKEIKFKQIEFPKKTINDKFDFIICSEVIEHLEDDRLALKRIHKLLNRDGILILTTPSINAPLHKWGLTKKFDKKVGHLRRYDIEDLKEAVIKSGFIIIESKITEGPLRNFLFINPVAGKFIRVINRFFSDPITIIDNLTTKIFGGSDIIIVAKKMEAE